jgi:hypothetical protein
MPADRARLLRAALRLQIALSEFTAALADDGPLGRGEPEAGGEPTADPWAPPKWAGYSLGLSARTVLRRARATDGALRRVGGRYLVHTGRIAGPRYARCHPPPQPQPVADYSSGPVVLRRLLRR